jgi:hypothetical protein
MAKQSKAKQSDPEPQPQSNGGIDWSGVEGSNQEFLDVYPRIQWMHGSKALKQLGDVIGHVGGLFIPETQFPNFEAENWAKATATVGEERKDIEGHWSKLALLSVIRMKRWWGDDGSHTHLLCHIKGVEGLFSIQVSGLSKGVAMEQAFTDHRKLIVQHANLNRPKGSNPIEPFALWFVVVPGPHSVQRSKSNPEASSEVTPPTLFLPKEINQAYIEKLYVGSENYKKFADSYKQTEAWQQQIPRNAQQQNQEKFDNKPYQKPGDDQEYTGMPDDSIPASSPTKVDDDIPF